MQTSLLDTDILSEVLKSKNPVVVLKAATYLALHNRFAISAMTRYEVMRGLKDKAAFVQLQKFEAFCQHVDVTRYQAQSSTVLPTCGPKLVSTGSSTATRISSSRQLLWKKGGRS